MNKKTLKSIGAVVAGFLVVVIFSIFTDTILESSGFFPRPDQGGLYDTGKLLFALFYRTLYTVAGGYATAMLAPDKKMKHVWILAILGQIGGILGVVGSWGKGLGPEWYPIALAVLAIPSVYLGGKLLLKRKAAGTKS